MFNKSRIIDLEMQIQQLHMKIDEKTGNLITAGWCRVNCSGSLGFCGFITVVKDK